MRSTKDDGKPTTKAGAKKSETANNSVGVALRAVYQDAVSESVPSEMLDLLNKLG